MPVNADGCFREGRMLLEKELQQLLPLQVGTVAQG